MADKTTSRTTNYAGIEEFRDTWAEELQAEVSNRFGWED